MNFQLGSKTYIMGILNVTPDSFSDGGIFYSEDAAIRHAAEMLAAGADIIDIGAESTRPGFTPVDATTEIARLANIIPAVKSLGATVSIDTTKPEVAEFALNHGADIINDVSATLLDTAKKFAAPIILMHNKKIANDIVSDVKDFIRANRHSGANIIFDVGIGFGKTQEENLAVLRSLREFKSLGVPLLLGVSRKSVIGYATGLSVDQRDEATGAICTLAIASGVDIVRVHNVAMIAKMCRMADVLVRNVKINPVAFESNFPSSTKVNPVAFETDKPAFIREKSGGSDDKIPTSSKVKSSALSDDFPSSTKIIPVASDENIPASAKINSGGLDGEIPPNSKVNSGGFDDEIPSGAKIKFSAFEDDFPSSIKIIPVASETDKPAFVSEKSGGSDDKIPTSSKVKSSALDDDFPSSTKINPVASDENIPASAKINSGGLDGEIPPSSKVNSGGLDDEIPVSAKIKSNAFEDDFPSSAKIIPVASETDKPAFVREKSGGGDDKITASAKVKSSALSDDFPSSAKIISNGVDTVNDKIILTGIEIFGRHGCTAEEQSQGQIFYVDAELTLDLAKAAATDNLTETVDYAAALATIEQIVGGTPRKLIETVAAEIITTLFIQFPAINNIKITLHKPNAPLPVKYADAAVQIERQRP